MRKLCTLTTLILAAALSGPAAAGTRAAGFRTHDASLSLWCESGKVGAIFTNVSQLKYYSHWDRQALDDLRPKLRIGVDDRATVDVEVTVDLGRKSLTASGDSDVNLLTTIGDAKNRITVSLDLPRNIGLERTFDVRGRVEKVRAMIDGCGLGD